MVTTKGVYVPKGTVSKERALYLLVQAPTQEQLDHACEWLQKVMSGQIIPESAAGMREYSASSSGPSLSSSPMAPTSGAPPSHHQGGAVLNSLGFDTKVFVGIEHAEAQAVAFSLIGKLFGQGGAWIYI